MKLFAIAFVFLLGFGCSAQKNTEKTTVLSAAEYKKQVIGKDVQLVDVRTSGEYAAGRIDDAINIDYTSADFKQKIVALDKNKPVYIYCQSGNRSGRASKVMEELGFTQIIDLQGGYGNYR